MSPRISFFASDGAIPRAADQLAELSWGLWRSCRPGSEFAKFATPGGASFERWIESRLGLSPLIKPPLASQVRHTTMAHGLPQKSPAQCGKAPTNHALLI